MNMPSDHRRWEEDVAAHALGALDVAEATAFETHLEECEDCRGELGRLASAVELLPASVEPLTPPPSLRRELMATVNAEATRSGKAPSTGRGSRFRLPRLRTLSAAAVACTLVIAVVPVEALAPRSDASAVLVRTDGSWALDVDRLPRIPTRNVYQVWVRNERGLQPSTVFVLSRSGAATVPVPGRLEDGDQVLVTREPRGGSKEPTTAPLLQARI
jgi:anti-sigma-K factor RskA